jgi:hypothetical protein
LLGISADIRFGAIEHMASQLTGGKLDGVVIAAGFPIPALAELDAKQQVDFVQPSSEQSSMIRNKMTEISPSVIPAGTYRSLARNYHTIGMYNFAIAHKDLPDEFHLQARKNGLRQSRGADEEPTVGEGDNSDKYRSQYDAPASSGGVALLSRGRHRCSAGRGCGQLTRKVEKPHK